VWAVVAGALGGSAVTGFVTWFLDRSRSKGAIHAQREETLRLACERLITAAIVLTWKFHVLQTQRTPVSLESAAYVGMKLETMMASQTTIWTFGDDDLILQTKVVVQAAWDIEPFADVPLAKFAATQAKAREDLLTRLGRETRILGQLMRKRFDTPDQDALLRVMPMPSPETGGSSATSGS
jgi:hypothetical protein